MTENTFAAANFGGLVVDRPTDTFSIEFLDDAGNSQRIVAPRKMWESGFAKLRPIFVQEEVVQASDGRLPQEKAFAEESFYRPTAVEADVTAPLDTVILRIDRDTTRELLFGLTPQTSLELGSALTNSGQRCMSARNRPAV